MKQHLFLSRYWSLLLACLLLQVPAWSEDPHSYARPGEARVTHLDLDVAVNFERRELVGTATWELKRSVMSDRIVLDTRGLQIRSVHAGDQLLSFEQGKHDPIFGQPLTVVLPEGVDKITIAYATSPDAAALQWLKPVQTADGKHPFLFTQSQAILARSWIPCQDGPAVRFTYNATVRVPKGLMAVMSAENPTELSANGVYTFKMPQAIPSYLMALAVGDLRFKSLGKVTGIYAEPSMLEKSAYEFADTEKMVDAVEKMYGPYRWGRYDMLMLPPSFPFGGMENPRLTFLTPTVIAGDRSLTSLIAHELAHSWSGNLVTNSNWNDFWLNEGFTVYLERRIMEQLYGKDYAAMLIQLGWDDLQHTLKELDSRDTHLKLDLKGRDPDDGLSDIAYEKGYFFLTHLERQVGREKFDEFLRGYFDKHAFKSAETEDFLALVEEKLGSDLGVAEWVYSPGVPKSFQVPPSKRFQQVDNQLLTWMAGTRAEGLQTEGWTTHEWLRFLRGIPEDVLAPQLAALDKVYGLTNSGNSEIQAQWFMAAIKANYEPAYPALSEFLNRVGRRKFLEPLYKELAKTPEGLARARSIYTKSRDNYHSVSVGTIDGILDWSHRDSWPK